MQRYVRALLASTLLLAAAAAQAVAPDFHTFESGQVRPLAVSPDGSQLFAVDTPDNQLEIFDIDGNGLLTHSVSVQVGMEPVAVAARTNDEVWVVNHLSDSVSVVRLDGSGPRVVRTLLVGDEPNDVVFAGPLAQNDTGRSRAFITTAHRGQNTPTPDGDFDTPGIGRADIWVFDVENLGASLGGDEETIITVFGDKPRGLAVSNDFSKVYAAIFHSGNQTTTVNEGLVCDGTSGSNAAGPCTINGVSVPGGYPPPHTNHESITRPETGLIVKFNRDGGTSNRWQDEVLQNGGAENGLPRNWNPVVRFNLPDRDVFEINANADPPVALDGSSTCSDGAGCWANVGTILFNMAVNPSSGKIYVSNTDAQNHVRFEGPGTYAAGKKESGEPNTVQGNLAQARITVLDGSNVDVRHLNKHLDYSVLKAPTTDRDKSLATPMGMQVSPDGSTLYVAAFGSSKIGVFQTSEIENNTFTPNAADHIQLGGGGPSGMALTSNRLYVLTRFDNKVRVINTGTEAEIQDVTLHNPEPAEVVNGRPFLYDARLTSSNGEASCSSCHIFGDLDDLAWDLGDPDGNQVANGNPFNPVIPPIGDPLPHVFHPIKGPMTTQSLRGLANMGPEHWRGDRQGNEIMAFEAFNVAFDGLVGHDGLLTVQQMEDFRKFGLLLRYPPNPIRALDNDERSGDETNGATRFSGPTTDIVANCAGCHVLDAPNGHFGGDGQTTFEGEPQHAKVPHLRNVYQKVGMFGVNNSTGGGTDGSFFNDPSPFGHKGDQIRGYGVLHDGSVDTVFRFTDAGLFSNNATQQRQLAAFVMVFPSDMAPIVGQQVTLISTSPGAVTTRIDLMETRAGTIYDSDVMGGAVPECDLIAKVVEGGRQRGYLFDPGALVGEEWQPDDNGGPISDATLKGKANTIGKEVTFTCVPPGSGNRMALDRDRDTLRDGVETDTGIFVDANDTGTSPASADTDGDGFTDPVEVAGGYDPTDPQDYPGAPPVPGPFPTQVPALSPLGMGGLVGMLMLSAGWATRRRRRNG